MRPWERLRQLARPGPARGCAGTAGQSNASAGRGHLRPALRGLNGHSGLFHYFITTVTSYKLTMIPTLVLMDFST